MNSIDKLTERIEQLGKPREAIFREQAIAAVVDPRNIAFFQSILDGGLYGPDGLPGLEERINLHLWAHYRGPTIGVLSLIVSAIDSIIQENRTAIANKPQAAAEPPGPRLELEEGRRRLRIDGKPHKYQGEAATYFLRMALKAAGNLESGSNLVSDTRTRADKVFKRLPAAIRAIFEEPTRGGTGGYQIKPEYFPK